MSNDNIDHLETDVDQIQKPDTCEIIHKSLPSYAFINPKTMQTCCHHQIEPISIDQNDPRTQFISVNHRPSGQLYLKTDSDQVRDYTGWSLSNRICSCLCPHLFALNMSHKTRAKKRKDDFEGAKAASKTTRLVNLFATVIGGIAISINICFIFFLKHFILVSSK
jgi:hypothetical protein